jgi:hypothetical protein
VLSGLLLRCRSWGLQIVWFDREINYIDLKQAAKKKNLKESSPNINTVRYGLSQSQR